MIKVNLKSILKEKNMTMTELHQKTGITINAISLFANNKSNGIQYNTLDNISNILNVAVGDIIYRVDKVFAVQLLEPLKSIHNNTHFQYNYKIMLENNDDVSDFHYINMSFNVRLMLSEINKKNVELLLINTEELPYIDKNEILYNNFYLFEVFKYVISEAIISDLKKNFNFFIHSKLITDFKTHKNTKHEHENTFEQVKAIKLVPENPDIEVPSFYDSKVIPNIDSLENISNVFSVDIDKDTYKRSVKVILDFIKH